MNTLSFQQRMKVKQRMLCRIRVVALPSFVALSLCCGAAVPEIDAVDWPAFMAEQDMVWKKLPSNWFEGPFLGNGEQGTLMYKLDKRTLRWDVGCSAAHDHRPIEEDDLTKKDVTVLNRGRHFIGHLRLELPADVTQAESRLSLWDAEATGTLKAKGGSVEWTTLVHATEPVMRFDLTAKGTLKGTKFVYVPEEARNPRALRASTLRKPRNEFRVPANPAPELATLDDGVQTAVQNLISGGQTAVAWIEKKVGDKTQLWLSVKHSFPGREAVDQAVAAVRAAAKADQAAWVQAHRDWWHNYYPQSFVSIGDRYWESFYWIQQYKLACATRDEGWIIDNQGPWLQPTAWNALWWNLNVQLSHSGGYTANRRGMVSAVGYRLGINRDNLARNVAEPYRADSYAIGRNVKLTSGHRHFSHLLAIYPLRTLTPETPADRELIDKSLKHWHSFGRGVAGYSYTGASCMASLLGDGDEALRYLSILKAYVRPNTLYYEIDHLPVMETPLHGATAIQEMLLQSWGGRLRVFPAVPSEWPDAQIHQLRGEGAYLVSARRERGKTEWVLVQAEAGGTVQVDPAMADAQWTASKGAKVKKDGNGVYTIQTEPGDWVMFWPRGQVRPKPSVTPVAPHGKEHHFGL